MGPSRDYPLPPTLGAASADGHAFECSRLNFGKSAVRRLSVWIDIQNRRLPYPVLVLERCGSPSIFPNCYRTRRLPLAESAGYAAKIGARVGAIHEKARPGGICRCINRREDQETHRLAWQNVRQHPTETP